MRLGADGARGLEQLVELEVVVAQRAGDGRAAGEVLVDEGPHDIALEALLLVDDVVGNAQVLGDAAGVVDIIERTAAAGLGRVGDAVLAGQAGLVPKLEGQADDVFAIGGAVSAWASIAATVEESTPPDMATAMVVGSVIVSGSASQRGAPSSPRLRFCGKVGYHKPRSQSSKSCGQRPCVVSPKFIAINLSRETQVLLDVWCKSAPKLAQDDSAI